MNAENSQYWDPARWKINKGSTLEICQCDLRWLSDEWLYRRRAIDDWIVQALLLGKVGFVRRLLLYDLPSDARIREGNEDGLTEQTHEELTTKHSEWIAGLQRDIAITVGRHSSRRRQRQESAYEIKLLILGRVTEAPEQPHEDWYEVDPKTPLSQSHWWTSERSIWANVPVQTDLPQEEVLPPRF